MKWMPSLAVAPVALLLAAVTLPGCSQRPGAASRHWAEIGDASRGPALLASYGCRSCHVIPGVAGPKARVGPRLAGLADQMFIGGVLPNRPANLVRWIRFPQETDSLTAMPDLGVSERDARDIAAYLYGIR
jgi:cytochrome c2